MKTAVLTDSTCDLPRETIEEKDYLHTIPLNINFAEEKFVDREDITPKEFFARIEETGELPSTSQPSVGDFLKIYDELAKDYDQVISLHLSGELSGTLNSSKTAAAEMEEVDIKIFDSKSASLGLGFQVLLTCRLLENGFSWPEIEKNLKVMRTNTRVCFTVDDLTYLEKGGRIGKASSLIGSILNFKPLLELSGDSGEVTPRGKVRGNSRLRKKLIKEIEEVFRKEEKVWLAILYGSRQREALLLKEMIEKKAGEKEIDLRLWQREISPVLGCHTGPSVYGLTLTAGDFLG